MNIWSCGKKLLVLVGLLSCAFLFGKPVKAVELIDIARFNPNHRATDILNLTYTATPYGGYSSARPFTDNDSFYHYSVSGWVLANSNGNGATTSVDSLAYSFWLKQDYGNVWTSLCVEDINGANSECIFPTIDVNGSIGFRANGVNSEEYFVSPSNTSDLWTFWTMNIYHEYMDIYQNGVLFWRGYWGTHKYMFDKYLSDLDAHDNVYGNPEAYWSDIAIWKSALQASDILAIYESNTSALNYQFTSCGDNICNGAETCATCAGDCGVCPLVVDVYNFGYPYLWSLNNTVFAQEEKKRFIVSWDTCSSWGEFDRAILYASLNGQLVGSSTYDIIGVDLVKPLSTFIGPQQCKGILTYFSDTYLNNDTTATGTVKFYLKTYTATGTVISTQVSNEISYTTKISQSFIIDIPNDPILVDLGSLPYGVYTSTSTPLYFYYNFVGENPASTTVTLWDFRNATSTGYTLTGGFSTTGNSSASISYPTPATSTNKIFRFIASRPGYPNIMSDTFIVDWSFNQLINQHYAPFVMPECKNPTWDISGVCEGVDTWDLIGQWTCSIRGGLGWAGIALFSPSCNSLDWVYDSYNDFKDSFPFNAFFDLTDSIDSAITTAKNSTSTAGGSFSIPFIRKTATSSEYYMLPVMSSTTISNTIGVTNYNGFRTTIGYIWWIIVAGIVFLIIWKA